MKKILSFLLVISLAFSLCSCVSSATTVNANISQKANNFEVLRKITVYNARTDTIIMDIVGYMSVSNNVSSELVVTCKTGDDTYKKHYVYLNDYTLYVVEDLDGSNTDPYHYETHFYTPLPDINFNN